MEPWHLKDISLTKNYCITINIKIISSIHIFIFKVQVLGSHELKSHCHLWRGTLKNDWINFQPSCICTRMQRFRLYILESHDWPHPFLTMPTQQIFDQLLTVINLHQHAKNQFILLVHSSDRVNFRVPSHDWPLPFLTTPTPKFSTSF